MKKLMMAVVGMLALAIVVGCELGGGGGGGSSGDAPDVTGTWHLTDLTYGKNATINLSQDGQILGGTIANFNGRHGVITGTINSSGLLKLLFTFPAGQTDATLQLTGDTLSGSWVDHRDGTTAQISGTR